MARTDGKPPWWFLLAVAGGLLAGALLLGAIFMMDGSWADAPAGS
jgi:hypothetical protein